MTRSNKSHTRQSVRLSAGRATFYLAVGAMVAVGVALIGNGLWIKAKASLSQVLLNQAFERVQYASGETSATLTNATAKPWAWADMHPIAKLRVARLDKSQIVLNNVSGEALAFGPGHLSNTPLPGERGTSVISAHRDTHFNWIGDLKSGDGVEVERTDGTKVKFTVRRAWVAHFKTPGINADSDEHLLALSTCYPFNAKTRGPMRYVVEAVMDEKPSVVADLK